MYKSISNDEFYQKEKKEPLDILDVRENYEYDNGHIPEAVNLPLSELGSRFYELDKSKNYYVICHSGARSANASEFLSAQGYQVTNVMGGMSAWRGDVI